MSASGVYIAFSMFHLKWKRVFGKQWNVAYQSVRPQPYNVQSKASKSIRKRRHINPVAFIVASKSNCTIDGMKNYHKVSQFDVPQCIADAF